MDRTVPLSHTNMVRFFSAIWVEQHSTHFSGKHSAHFIIQIISSNSSWNWLNMTRGPELFCFFLYKKSFSPVWTVQVLSYQSALCIVRVRKITGYMIAYKIRFYFIFLFLSLPSLKLKDHILKWPCSLPLTPFLTHELFFY